MQYLSDDDEEIIIMILLLFVPLFDFGFVRWMAGVKTAQNYEFHFLLSHAYLFSWFLGVFSSIVELLFCFF